MNSPPTKKSKAQPAIVRVGATVLGPYSSLRAAHSSFGTDYKERFAPESDLGKLPALSTIQNSVNKTGHWFGFLSVDNGGSLPLPVNLSFHPTTVTDYE